MTFGVQFSVTTGSLYW